MRRSYLHLLGGVLFSLPLLFASCGNGDNALEEIINGGGSSTTVAVTGISLEKTTLELQVGKTGQLTATVTPDNATDKTVKWSSNKEDIATVDASGLVTALVVGTATITAQAGDKSATCEVTVTPSLSTPLTVEAITAGTITITSPQGGMKYSKNDGAKINISADPTTISVAAGDKVAFYGTATSYNGTKIGGDVDGFKCKVYGNIMSLLYEDFADKTELPDNYTFYSLFNGNTKLIDASGLLMPATTLKANCYGSMFKDCTSLTAAPAELPATDLTGDSYCYSSMFDGCKALTTAPELKATTLVDGCYGSMFRDCKALTTAPELKATTLANYCYQSMFKDCSSLTTAPTELPATTLKANCYESMFNGCSSLTTAPVLKATTLVDGCYQHMFQDCKALTTAPELKVTTLANCCYQSMFKDCSSLTTAPTELPATTLKANCYESMFNGCSSLTTAPAIKATTLDFGCCSSMFNGCSSLTTAPELKATTLADYCYMSMFDGCTSLNSVTCLATDISATSCTQKWLNGVSATGTFTKASGMDWSGKTGYDGIPSGWTVNNQ